MHFSEWTCSVRKYTPRLAPSSVLRRVYLGINRECRQLRGALDDELHVRVLQLIRTDLEVL
jgi:hypothetical protein